MSPSETEREMGPSGSGVPCQMDTPALSPAGGLDTSGVVYVLVPGCVTERPRVWPDLTPFTQGALTAALEEFNKRLFASGGYTEADFFGFRHLAPETVARFIEDCAEMVRDGGVGDTVEDGRVFWEGRNAFKPAVVRAPKGSLGLRYTLRHWPRLTLFVADDGLIRIREGS